MSNSKDSGAVPRGTLFVVSAPSGTGKTTAVEKLVERMPDLALSRSYTSRQARQGERDGVDYNFVSREQFERMIAENEIRDANTLSICARLVARGFLSLDKTTSR